MEFLHWSQESQQRKRKMGDEVIPKKCTWLRPCSPDKPLARPSISIQRLLLRLISPVVARTSDRSDRQHPSVTSSWFIFYTCLLDYACTRLQLWLTGSDTNKSARGVVLFREIYVENTKIDQASVIETKQKRWLLLAWQCSAMTASTDSSWIISSCTFKDPLFGPWTPWSPCCVCCWTTILTYPSIYCKRERSWYSILWSLHNDS